MALEAESERRANAVSQGKGEAVVPAFESVVPGGTTIKVNAPTLDAVCWDMVDAPSVAEGITVLLKALVSTTPASHLVRASIYTGARAHAHAGRYRASV